MLSFAGSLQVFVALEPCDMRKSFNGLYALASERLGEDPQSGAIFVFTNKRRNRLKVLWFDSNGYCILYKRLHRARFHLPLPSEPDAAGLRIDGNELARVLRGVDRQEVRRRRTV